MERQTVRAPAALKRTLGWIAAALALAAVFTSYLQPDLIVDLANRLWSCF